MKYVAKEIEENYNIGSNNPFRTFIKLVIVIGSFVAGLYVLLSFLINVSVGYIPESWDNKIGDYFVKKIEGIDSEKAFELENRIQELIGENEYSVKIIDSKEINAFAMSGKNIIVLKGLVDKMTDAEIDFVLAHEIGHFENRDVTKKYARIFIFSVLSSLISSDDSNILSKILLGTEMKFSQNSEIKADRFAADIYYRKYNNIEAIESFFGKISKEDDESKFDSYFSSHPKNDKRLEEIKKYLEN